MQIQEFQIPHHGRCVDAVFYRPEAVHRFPVILFSHGYNGCKTDFDTSAAYFAESGIGAVCFTFCGGSLRDRSGFATTEMTLFTEKEDLYAVLDEVKAWECVDSENIFLFGASQGGMVSALAAEERGSDIRGLILLYPAFCIADDWKKRFPTREEIPDTQDLWGMPLGRAIGLALGWRMTFGCVGVIAAVLLVYQAVVFPQLPAGEPFSLRRLPELLGNRVLVALYVVTMCLATGYYAGYGYIEPFLGQIGGFDATTTTVLLTVFGAAGFVASFLFARFFDGHRYRFVGTMVVGFTAMLFCLQAAAASLATTVTVCLLWGICGTAFNIALQAMLMDAAPEDDATVAMAIYSGLFNFGIGTGTAIGGVVVSNIALSAIGYAGGAIALVGVVLAIGWLFRLDRAARAARAGRA